MVRLNSDDTPATVDPGEEVMAEMPEQAYVLAHADFEVIANVVDMAVENRLPDALDRLYLRRFTRLCRRCVAAS